MIVVSTLPQDSDINVGLLNEIRITFDSSIDPATIDDSSVVVASTSKDVFFPNVDRIPIATSDLIEDSIFTEAFKEIVQGTVTIDSIDDKVLVFTPKSFYKKNTQYKVVISNTIADTGAVLLDSIYALTFKSTSEEQVKTTPVEAANVIVDNEFVIKTINSDTVSSTEVFYLTESDPNNGDIFGSGTSLEFTFSTNVDTATVAANLSIKAGDVLGDFSENVPYQHSVTNTVLTVTPTTTIPDNKIVEVKLKPNLADTNGNILTTSNTSLFATILTPYYGSISIARFLAGSLIQKVPNLTIALGLYYHSQKASRLFNGLTATHLDALKNRYAVIKTLKTLLMNSYEISAAGSISKKLGDFSITVDNGSSAALNNRLIDDIERELQGFTNYLSLIKSQPVVRGINHVDYPTSLGRLWDSSSTGVFNAPGSVKTRKVGSLRSRWTS